MTWRFWRKEQPAPEPEHKHFHKATHCRVMREGNGDVVTILIRLCQCGDHDYFRIPGEWTMEELTGKPPAFDDGKFLKECGIKRFG